MKRLVDLTTQDLSVHRVWRYEGGKADEALVSPARRSALSRSDDEIFLAATSYQLFDSTPHSGFCFPADGTTVDYLQPVILTRSGHVAFWFDGPVSAETLEKQWRALERKPSDIFPIFFRCLVPVDGRVVEGRIAGVEHSEEDASATDDAPPPTRRRGVGTSETRTTRRRKAQMTVEFSQGARQGTGVTGDVSRRGMFVRSPWIPGAGPVLRLTVNLPGGRKLSLTGRVVRGVEPGKPSTRASGFGLRLIDDWPDFDDLFRRRPKK